MNELRRIAPSGHDLDRIRDVVSKHLSPEPISDYFVEFGAFDDEPAMFITFHTAGPRPAFDDVGAVKLGPGISGFSKTRFTWIC